MIICLLVLNVGIKVGFAVVGLCVGAIVVGRIVGLKVVGVMLGSTVGLQDIVGCIEGCRSWTVLIVAVPAEQLDAPVTNAYGLPNGAFVCSVVSNTPPAAFALKLVFILSRPSCACRNCCLSTSNSTENSTATAAAWTPIVASLSLLALSFADVIVTLKVLVLESVTKQDFTVFVSAILSPEVVSVTITFAAEIPDSSCNFIAA